MGMEKAGVKRMLGELFRSGHIGAVFSSFQSQEANPNLSKFIVLRRTHKDLKRAAFFKCTAS